MGLEGRTKIFMAAKYVHGRHFNSKYKRVSEKGNNNCVFIIEQENAKYARDTP